jgi:hypothetical protein
VWIASGCRTINCSQVQASALRSTPASNKLNATPCVHAAASCTTFAAKAQLCTSQCTRNSDCRPHTSIFLAVQRDSNAPTPSAVCASSKTPAATAEHAALTCSYTTHTAAPAVTGSYAKALLPSRLQVGSSSNFLKEQCSTQMTQRTLPSMVHQDMSHRPCGGRQPTHCSHPPHLSPCSTTQLDAQQQRHHSAHEYPCHLTAFPPSNRRHIMEACTSHVSAARDTPTKQQPAVSWQVSRTHSPPQ